MSRRIRDPRLRLSSLIDKYRIIIGLDMPGHTVEHAYVLTGISYLGMIIDLSEHP